MHLCHSHRNCQHIVASSYRFMRAKINNKPKNLELGKYRQFRVLNGNSKFHALLLPSRAL